jgi:hypothetical protein
MRLREFLYGLGVGTVLLVYAFTSIDEPWPNWVLMSLRILFPTLALLAAGVVLLSARRWPEPRTESLGDRVAALFYVAMGLLCAVAFAHDAGGVFAAQKRGWSVLSFVLVFNAANPKLPATWPQRLGLLLLGSALAAREGTAHAGGGVLGSLLFAAAPTLALGSSCFIAVGSLRRRRRLAHGPTTTA